MAKKLISKRHKPIPIKQKLSIKNRIVSFFEKTWNRIYAVIGVIVIILGLLQAPEIFDFINNKYFTTDREKVIKETQYSGDLKPNPIQIPPIEYSISDNPPSFNVSTLKKIGPPIKGILIKNYAKKEYIMIVIGGATFKCFTSDLSKGIDVYDEVVNKILNRRITLGVKNDRLYISTKFIGLESDELIGNIEFNHWIVYKKNSVNYRNDDERLQVQDNQGRIVFEIKYTVINNISWVLISGYIKGYSNILVLPNNNYKSKIVALVVLRTDFPAWKDSVMNEIEKIKPIF